MNDRPLWLTRLAIPELTPEAFALEAEAQLLNDAASIAGFVTEKRGELRRNAISGLTAAALYSDAVDAALRRMFLVGCRSLGIGTNNGESPGLAVVATGGYGRRELAPFSDIDVAFMPAREEDPGIDALVRALFHLMMDSLSRKAGLKVGYAYRWVGDCGALEVQTQTSLIDARFITGDYSIFSDYRKELRSQIAPARFVFDKAWERTVARENAGGTIYLVEPEIKNGPGGLREIQTAMWLAQVKFGAWSPAVWEELIDRDVVGFREVERLYEGLDFLHRVRNALHWRAGKQNDLLMMARQGDVAETLGIAATDGLTPSQALLQAFYRYAEQISSVATRVVNWVLESRLDLGSGLTCIRRRMECASPEIFLSQPANIVRAFEISQALNIPLATELQSLIREATEGRNRLQTDRECGPLLLRILEFPERIWLTLTNMAQLGTLGWLLPEFAALMRLAPRDSAHEFTVGYHSLELVRRLEEMKAGVLGETAAEAFSHLDYPATLYLSGLLHDAGKAIRGGKHAESGAELVPAIGIRLGLAPHEVSRLHFLVAQHLVMSEVARFRDLTQESSIRELLSVAPDQESIDCLFLLTLADGLSVGKGVWSQLQTRFLEELYHRASQAIAFPVREPDEGDLRRYQRRIAQALTGRSLNQENVEQHVEYMPASYLLNTSSDIIALHIEMLQKLQATGKPVVEYRDDRDGQFSELIICALDDPKPGLLSKVAGCLWANDIDVHSAQVYTRAQEPRIAIDTLWIDHNGHNVDPKRKRRLEKTIVDVLSGEQDVRSVLKKMGKGSELDAAIHAPEVSAHRTDDHLICEVRTGDHRGLLYQLTRTFSALGWDIHSARINSSSSRTRDVFYVTTPDDLAAEDAARLFVERLESPRADDGS